jgi:hypothetical protein
MLENLRPRTLNKVTKKVQKVTEETEEDRMLRNKETIKSVVVLTSFLVCTYSLKAEEPFSLFCKYNIVDISNISTRRDSDTSRFTFDLDNDTWFEIFRPNSRVQFKSGELRSTNAKIFINNYNPYTTCAAKSYGTIEIDRTSGRLYYSLDCPDKYNYHQLDSEITWRGQCQKIPLIPIPERRF